MHVVLILNPLSGASVLAATQGTSEEHELAILTALRTYGIEPEVRYTTAEEDGAGLAKQAADEKTDMIIVAGGDGTIHAVATGLIGSESTLGIIPLGTMNNIAQSLHIPTTVEAACAIIARGETQCIDVGKVNDHYFIEVVGIGLEAALFPAAEAIKQSGMQSIIRGTIEGLKALFAFRTTKLELAFDDKKRRVYEAMQVTVCNSAYYGVHMQAAPNALMDDGLLDVVIYKNFSKLEFLAHAASISRGQRSLQPKISYRRVKSLRITAQEPLQIHADGVSLGHTPAVIHVVPRALRIRIPGKTVSGKLRDYTQLEDMNVAYANEPASLEQTK